MKSIHYIIYMAFAALSFTACQEEELFADYGEGTGTLMLSGIEVVSEVGDIQTRASMNDADIPSADEFTIELLDANTQEFVQKLELNTRYNLEVGSYLVRAYYGDKEAMSKTPYFFAEKSLTVADGKAETLPLRPTLACAIIQPRVAEDLEAQYNNYTLTILETSNSKEPVSEVLVNGEDFYVAGGADRTYSLTLAGQNKLGEEVSHTWTYSDLAACTRYIVNCNPDLPSFSLPEQAETNAWSKFIYVTPVTEANFSYIPEGMTADEILANLVYEASTDGQTWNPAITDDDKIVFTGLTPSTEYTIRARFGGVNSDNTAIQTTENAQELTNGDMEEWNRQEYANYANRIGGGSVYLYTLNGGIWGTRNSVTMNGVEGGTSGGTENQRVAYRWNSCTIQTDDAISGTAAEIRTMALANFDINEGTFDSWLAAITGKRSEMVSNVLNNATVYIGWLYIGKDATETDGNDVEHTARPLSLSFDYKYTPYNTDNMIVSAALYDENHNQIAYIDDFKSGETQTSYKTEVLDFVYENPSAKAKYIYIMFKSGENSTINDVKHIEGGYDANPWSLDTFVGSVLKIDNVVLNYDYE